MWRTLEDGRQPERPRPQAGGSRIRRLRQILRQPDAQNRIPADGGGAPGARTLSRSHGSADPSHARQMRFFFMPTCFELQSTLHAAIIMDGNGRWALGRGLPRAAGHRAGVEAARRVVDAAPEHGIGVLTLFAFSSDNWRREPVEVAALMRLLAWYLESQTEGAVAAGGGGGGDSEGGRP